MRPGRCRPWPTGGETVWWSWSEPRRDGEEEAALRRIRTEVDIPHDGLLTVVAHFRIVAEVIREEQQVPPGDAHASSARAEPVGEALGQVEGNACLPELQERG